MAHVDKEQQRKHAQFTSHPGSRRGDFPEHENERTHPLVHDTTELTPWYRFLWRLKCIGLDIYSTASRHPGINPRDQLRKERPISVRHAIGQDS